MDLFITLLVSALSLVMMFFYFRGRIRQELNATELLRNVRDEIDGMVKELNQSAERNIALLETRLSQMEELLAQADQKLVILARETTKRERTDLIYSNLKKPASIGTEAITPASTVVADIPLPQEPQPVEPLVVVASGSASVPEFFVKETPVRSVELPLKDKVIGLRREGLPAAAIAQATGVTQAEVELILSLNPEGL